MWDQLRAALVALHLIAVTLLALPSLRGLRPNHLNHPEAVAALTALSEATDQPVEVWESRVLGFSRQTNRARLAALAPFRRYYALTGTKQGWRMFGVVNRQPARLEIHLDLDGRDEWTPIFISPAPDGWRANLLNHERVRSLFNNFSYRRAKGLYPDFIAWVSREVVEEYPTAQRVRVQLRRRPPPPPKKLRKTGQIPNGKVFWSEVRTLQ